MPSQRGPTGNHPEHRCDLAVLTDISLLFLFVPLCPSADYVYFENSSSNPLLIRRIEELNKVSVCMSVRGRTLTLEDSADLTHFKQPYRPTPQQSHEPLQPSGQI